MDTSMQPAGFTNGLEHTSAALVLCSVDRSGGSATVEVIEANPASYRLCRTGDRAGLEAVLSSAIAAGDSATDRGTDVPSPSGTHERMSFEYTIHGESPDPVHVMIELVVITESRESSAETMVYLKDITPGRTLQKELEWLSALPEANPNIVLIMACPNRIEYVNATGRAWLERRGSESWDDLHRLLPDDYGETICAACDRSDRLNWTIQFDGHDYDVRKTPLPDGERCMITVNDVSEFRELSRQHEVFFQAFRSSHTPILITDSEGTINFVNERFEDLYGYPHDSVIGRSPSIVNPGRAAYHELGFSDADYDQLFGDMWSAITDPELGYWEREIPNQTADGRIVWVRLLIHAVRDDYGEISSYIGFPVDVTDSRDRELRLRLEAYEAISDLAELRDNETGNHIKRVGRYAMELAGRLGHSKSFQEEMLNFAPLHDIGKVGIPDGILLAPRSLSEEEFANMKRHTTLGYELFRSRPSLETAASIAHAHHERWDGTGYPRGLAGEDIPLCARIVSVCDVYDALRSERPYKSAWTHADTVAYIESGRGTQFDPEVVDAFLSCHDCIDGIHAVLPD